MISEIIAHNVAVFVSFALTGILSGIVWKWKPVVAVIALALFTVMFVFLVWCMIITPVVSGGGFSGGFSTDLYWYHYIGSLCGGLVWTTMFDVGKNIYTSMVTE